MSFNKKLYVHNISQSRKSNYSCLLKEDPFKAFRLVSFFAFCHCDLVTPGYCDSVTV